MKKLWFIIMLLSASIACTEHDPFDVLPDSPEVVDEPLWILSRFLQENYSSESGEVFFAHKDLGDAGLLESPVLYENGFCRVPTSGELQMIFPKCEDPAYLGQYNISLPLVHEWCPAMEGIAFKETAFLGNKKDYSADFAGEVISGDSEFLYIEGYEDDAPDFIPNFALRFKGTSQYAAYMYQIKTLEFDTHNEYFFNLKAKWLGEKDVTTKMEDIIKPEYWASGYLELDIPIKGFWTSSEMISDFRGRLISSTLEDGKSVLGSFSQRQSGMDTGDVNGKYNLRMIRCKENGEL